MLLNDKSISYLTINRRCFHKNSNSENMIRKSFVKGTRLNRYLNDIMYLKDDLCIFSFVIFVLLRTSFTYVFIIVNEFYVKYFLVSTKTLSSIVQSRFILPSKGDSTSILKK